jgi:glycosyltransferase involved in cell wall biosynthesis
MYHQAYLEEQVEAGKGNINGKSMNQGGLRTRGIRKHSLEKYPLVSIITVVYNGESSIERTIKSVLGQTYGNIEYIIIDGGSSDNTIKIIETYSDKIDFWISEPDRGIADAFNKGISCSNGDIVGIINADDWYETETVQIIINNLRPYPAVYSGHMNLLTNNGEKLVKLHKSRPERLSQTMRVAHPSTFVHRTVYDKAGNYSTEYKSAMDYDFFLRVRAYPFEIVIIDKVLSNMRLGGISRDLPMVLKEELRVKNRRLGRKIQHLAWYLASLTGYLIKNMLQFVKTKIK